MTMSIFNCRAVNEYAVSIFETRYPLAVLANSEVELAEIRRIEPDFGLLSYDKWLDGLEFGNSDSIPF